MNSVFFFLTEELRVKQLGYKKRTRMSCIYWIQIFLTNSLTLVLSMTYNDTNKIKLSS